MRVTPVGCVAALLPTRGKDHPRFGVSGYAGWGSRRGAWVVEWDGEREEGRLCAALAVFRVVLVVRT